MTATVGLALALEVGLLDGRVALGAATVLLLAYVTAELRALRASVPAGAPWLVSPISVASVYTIGIGFGVTNILFWQEGFTSSLPSTRALDFYWLSIATLQAVVAACAMWVGFRSGAGRGLGRSLWRSRVLVRMLQPSSDARWAVVWTFVLVSMVSRLVLLSQGNFGILRDAEGSSLAFRQYINYGGSVGLLSVIAVAVHVFSRPWRRAQGVILIVLVLHEVMWGLVAADKSNMLMPVVVVGFVYYIVKLKLPIRYALAGIVLVIASYVILMPMRKMAGEFNSRSVSEVFDVAMGLAASEMTTGTPVEGLVSNVGLAFLQRVNTTLVASVGLRYHAENPDDPVPRAFLVNTVLAPLQGLIPRALWPDKPQTTETGRWFYTTVLGGKSEKTLAGPTLVGYLNFTGGVVAIVIGFFLLGIVQRGVHDRFLFSAGGARVVMLLGMAGVIGQLPSQYGPIFVQLFRLFPMLLVAQFLMFRPTARTAPRSLAP